MAKYFFTLNNIDDRWKTHPYRGIILLVSEYDNFEEDGRMVFNTISLQDYPLFLKNAIQEVSASYSQTSGLIFGPDPGSEWDNIKPTPTGFVELITFCGHSQIPFEEFYELCLQFGYKALEAVVFFYLLKNGEVDTEWIKSIENIIPQIEHKIKMFPSSSKSC